MSFEYESEGEVIKYLAPTEWKQGEKDGLNYFSTWNLQLCNHFFLGQRNLGLSPRSVILVPVHVPHNFTNAKLQVHKSVFNFHQPKELLSLKSALILTVSTGNDTTLICPLGTDFKWV